MTPSLVSVSELAERLDELLELSASGVEVIITDDSGPRARLLPLLGTTEKRVLGLHRGAITVSPDFDDPLPDSFWLGDP